MRRTILEFLCRKPSGSSVSADWDETNNLPSAQPQLGCRSARFFPRPHLSGVGSKFGTAHASAARARWSIGPGDEMGHLGRLG